MFEHALKLLWNRRQASRLVIIEIAAAFLVVFVVLALTLHAWGNYRRPLGFEYQNIWGVFVYNDAFREDYAARGDEAPVLRAATNDIRAAMRLVPGVLAADTIRATPFAGNRWVGGFGREGTPQQTWLNTLSLKAVADLGVRIVAGRTFGPEDYGQDYRAALVNRDFVELAYGGESPLGKRINFTTKDELARLPPEMVNQVQREIRVVGVIEDFRQDGEFAERTPYAIFLDDPSDSPAISFYVKVAPGTDRRLEQRIVAAVSTVGAGFKATVTPWVEIRETNHRRALLPLRIGVTIAIFLLAMVVLGLIGIVWQDVLRRTREIGVRRAAGASVSAVRGQILLETLVIGSIGILLGTLVAIQIPLLEIIRQIDWAAAGPALALSALLILGLATGAALYPASLASRREPADALRYD